MFVLFFTPFASATEQTRQVLNELTVLVVNYHLICFTDFVSVEMQIHVGNSLIYVIVVNMLANLLLSLVEPAKKLSLYTKRYYLRF